MRKILSLIFLLVLLAACKPNSSSHDGRPVVAVSTPALGHIVDRVSGGEVETVVLVPEGADPETYEPDMSAMKSVAEAGVFLSLNTPGFEEKLTRQLSESMPSLRVADLSAGIPRLSSAGYGNHTEGDPHLLASPANACLVTDNAAGILSELYPEKADSFRKNGNAYKTHLEAISKKIRAMLESDAENGGEKVIAFVITHPSLSYFARDYGLLQLPLERDGKEATPRQLEVRLQEAAMSNPRIVVYERSHSPGQARLAAESLGIPQFSVDFNAADFDAQYIALGEAIFRR